MYKFPTRLPARPKTPNIYVPPAEQKQEEIRPVNGIMPDSIEEYRVAMVLWKLKVRFDYQVPIKGGTLLRGGRVIDFVVYVPYAQPVEVYGKYWHTGVLGSDDRMKMFVAQTYFRREVIVLWDYELQTQQQTEQTVRMRLRI